MKCDAGVGETKTRNMTGEDYHKATEAIFSMLANLDETCNGMSCQRADWVGCALRMAGHDFMDFMDGTGGSDGCVDLDDPDNVGLHDCLFRGEFGFSIDSAYQHFCTTISLADFIVLAGEAAMRFARNLAVPNDTALDFKTGFKYGRETSKECPSATGRLPKVGESCAAVKTTFVDRLGLTWRESAALMGVHTLGRAKPENSGFNGFWSDPMNSRIFNNDYYKSLLNKGWEREILGHGKAQWKRVDEGIAPITHKEMMLDTDLCLAYDVNGADLKAAQHTCCAWRLVDASDEISSSNGFCGHNKSKRASTGEQFSFDIQKKWCCSTTAAEDCGAPSSPGGKAFADVDEFAVDEAAWLQEFMIAWHKATERGFDDLKSLD